MKKTFKISFTLILLLVFGNFFTNPIFAEDVNPLESSEIIVTTDTEAEQEETISETELVELEPEPAPEENPAEDPAGDTLDDAGFQIEENIVLENGCEVEDKDGVKHIFPESTSGAEYLAICALEEALEQNIVDNIEFVDFGFGLFVNSVNETTEENTYWKLNINGVGASVGASQLEVGALDTVSLVLTAFDPATFEETPLNYSVTLTIDSLSPEFNNIELPDHCSVTDSGGVTHEFPEGSSPSNYLAVCALVSAKEAGKISDFKLTDSSFGLYVQSVNNTEPSDTEYWALWLNGEFANCGVVCLGMEKGDVLSLILSDWMANTESTNIKLRIIDLASSPEDEEDDSGDTSGGGGSPAPASKFSVPDALSYLKSVQSSRGSFGDSDLYTDWAAIAYGAGNVGGSHKSSLLEYLSTNNSISSLITDNERRAMALMALGENPYSFHGKNYIDAIIDDFDGTQFGDEDLVNDDIFALIPLSSAGYDEGDEIIAKGIDFILGEQKTNGSWEGSVDVTAAAVQALVPFDSVEGVTDALSKAETYLKTSQSSEGGWQNVSSTSWAMQAESALGGSWVKNGKSGLDYLASQQENADNNGAVLPSSESSENIIWATSYAISAGLGKPWSEIMDSVSKPEALREDDSDDTSDTEEDVADPVSVPIVTDTPPTAPEIIPAVLDTTPPTVKETIVVTKPSVEKEEESFAVTDTAEITPDSLAATVINTLPEDPENSQNLPIILGTASGLILLYVAFKFFI